MVAHTESVKGWGLEPCGRRSLPITTCLSAGEGDGVAPRPPGTGRGDPGVKTLLNSALKRAYGGRQIAGLAKRRANNEQLPPPAAAPPASPIAMGPSDEGYYCGWSGGVGRVAYLSHARLSGDPGTAEYV